jgi:hypothetical protein
MGIKPDEYNLSIKILRNETSHPIEYGEAQGYLNSYTKGPLYCVLVKNNGIAATHKYPLTSIFRIEEIYGVSSRVS